MWAGWLKFEVVADAEEMPVRVFAVVLCDVAVEDIELVLLADVDVGADGELPLAG